MLSSRIKKFYLDSSRYPPLVFLVSKLSTILPLILLLVAIVVVRRLLIEYTYDEVIGDIQVIPKFNLFIAFILSCLNYVVLTFYDYLGTRYVKAKIPIKRVALASFIAYAFSQNLGASILSGGAVRYRFYQKEGLSGTSIAKIIGFTAFHFWLGLFFLGGVLSILLPESFSEVFHVSEFVCRLIGAGILFPSLLYLFFLYFPNLLERKYRRLLPKKELGLSGLLVCVSDWFLAACVFYMTLSGEHEITLLRTIAAFIGAQVAGVLSHVPGGLGVFEATVAFLLSPHHDNSELISSLIVFRLIYYFIPFVVSVLLLISFELASQTKRLSSSKSLIAGYEFLENIFLASSPLINSLFCIFTGIILVLGSSYPSSITTPFLLNKPMPLGAYEASHFFASLLGVVLIFIGVGLRRRIKETWKVSFTLLCILLPVSLFRGGEFEFIFLLSNTLFLYFTRKAFYRSGAFIGSFTKARWTWAVGIVIISIVVGFFSFQDYDYTHGLWFQFHYDAHFPRFLRSIIAMLVGLVGCGACYAFAKPKDHIHSFPTQEDLTVVSNILEQSPSTMGYLSYTCDKEILFSEKKDAFLMWRQSGSSFVCLSDPQGVQDSFSEIAWQFRELSEESSKLCAFYEISTSMIPVVMDMGLRIFKIGEEGTVDLTKFSLSGSKGSSLRNVVNKMKKDGISFRIIERDEVSNKMPELKAVSSEWLLDKNTSEKGFSLGFFDQEYLKFFRHAVIERNGEIIGFANVFESKQKYELSIDLMRHKNEVPNGVMDFLFVNLFEWGKAEGYQTFSLGMAPLSGLVDNPLAPNYAKLGNLVYRHGGHFYNFDGLRKYKDKYQPTWHPRYLACPSGIYLPIVLSNISTLISGGLKGLITKN